MAFEGLSDKLSAAFKRLRNKGKLTEADVKEAMREVRLALLEADVNYKVAKGFYRGGDGAGGRRPGDGEPDPRSNGYQDRQRGADRADGRRGRPAGQRQPSALYRDDVRPSGCLSKTTHAAKLGKWLKGQGHRPLLAACDVYRPAAIKQLQVVGGQAGVPVLRWGPPTRWRLPVRQWPTPGLWQRLCDPDTAYRLHIDEQLMDELKNIKAAVSPRRSCWWWTP